MNAVHLALARREAAVIVLMDQAAAFDTTGHSMHNDYVSSWFGVGDVVLG